MKEETILSKLGIKTLKEWKQAVLGKRRINGSIEIQRSLYSMLISNRQHLPLKDAKHLNKQLFGQLMSARLCHQNHQLWQNGLMDRIRMVLWM